MHDPVLSDLASELRRDELNDLHEAAMLAAQDEAVTAVYDALFTAIVMLDSSGWKVSGQSGQGRWTKGNRELVCETDGNWWARRDGKLMGVFSTAKAAAEATR